MLVGQQLGPFAIEKELGSGAMGAVYLARYVKTGQRVAVKVMAPGLGANEKAFARFEREAAILKQLQHPNIVRLFGHGKFHGTPYYAMEYLQGESLDKVMQRRGRFTWEEVVTLGQQLCSALQHAHEQGIIHRDLKPSNIMVLADGTLKLTDFGIAKDLDVTRLTSANCTVGTAAYMSPEQCKGEPNLSHKSDLYSLGVLFYELLTGKKPFQADNAMELFLQHAQGTFERPSRVVLDIPVWLDTLVCQLLEKKPEQRPLDAAMVAQALDRVQEKVMAQQSAGVEAVRTRFADRATLPAKVDETDREAARVLRPGRHRRRHKRRRPFFQKVWFQAVLLSAALVAIGAFLYATLKPASPEQLYEQAEKLLATGLADRKRARDGPIEEFLRHYPDHPRAEQMRKWADEVDLEFLEFQLPKILSRKLDGDAEHTADAAVRAENAGDLNTAARNWEELAGNQSSANRDLHVWGLLAVKRLKELKRVDQRGQQLRDQVAQARQELRLLKPETLVERQAAEAIRYELFGDLAMARDRWQQVKHEQAKSEQRLWFLLAAKKARELGLREPPKTFKEEKEARQALVKQKYDEALHHKAQDDRKQARILWQDIVELYSKEEEAEVGATVKQASLALRDLEG